MKKEYTILVIVTAMLSSVLTGYFLTRPSGQTGTLNSQVAILGRFSGDLGSGEATTLPLPDGLFQVTTDIVLSPTTDPVSGDILYYHADNGFVSRADIASRRSALISQTALPGLRNVIWSPDRQRVVTVFSGQRGQVYQYFNYQTRAHGTLPVSVIDAAFSPDGNSLALAEQIGDETDIVIAQDNGTNSTVIFKTHLPHVTVSWPQARTLALVTKDDAGLASMYLLGDDGGLTKVIDSETGLRFAWSPDGSKLLYSTAEEGLMVYDTASGQYGLQPVVATANLCAWYSDNQSFVCAIDDKGEVNLQSLRAGDATIKDIASNLIISPEKLFLASDEEFVVILSQSDHTLYAIKLN